MRSADMSHGDRHARYAKLIAAAQELPRLKVAVAHPCDPAALGGALQAAELGLIEPILVGPLAKIWAAASEMKDVNLARFRLVDAEHSHDSAAKLVALVRAR